MIRAGTVDALLHEAFPIPDNIFEQTLRVQQLETACATLKKSYSAKRIEFMGEILTRRLSDERFRILHAFERHVDLHLLRAKRFELYKRIVYLKASDAKELLGERMLYDLCLETDEEFTRQRSLVRTEDLVSLLGAEACQFLVECLSPAQARISMGRVNVG